MPIKIKSILKNLLNQNHLSPAQLARLTKIPPQTINNWLSGQEPRKIRQVAIVARYFDVSIDFLLLGHTLRLSHTELKKELENIFLSNEFEFVIEKVLIREKE